MYLFGLNRISVEKNLKLISILVTPAHRNHNVAFPKDPRLIIGPHLFFLCINDFSQAVVSNLLLYSDDTSIIFQQNM